MGENYPDLPTDIDPDPVATPLRYHYLCLTLESRGECLLLGMEWDGSEEGMKGSEGTWMKGGEAPAYIGCRDEPRNLPYGIPV